MSAALSPIAQLFARAIRADAEAQQHLAEAQTNDFPSYLQGLAGELAKVEVPPEIRQAIALDFKNALTSNENQRARSDRWLAVSQDIRQPCKDIFLQTLGSTEGGVASAAAQAIAAIASIELPFGQWPEVVPKLLQLASHGENVQIRVAALRAIGFICEKESFVKSEYLASCSNEILTAVVQGVRKEEQSEQVQEAAIKALYNSLKFIDTNFSREGERNYIMQVVCEATQSGSEIVQVTAFECLVEIMGLYYEYMEFYMERALFGLTVMGLKSAEESVALQAIEFWSTVCEQEIEIGIEAQEALAYGEEPPMESKHFAKMALNEILPVLLDLICEQDEDADEDEWSKSKAALTCLELFARNVGDAIVQPVVPFIEAGIQAAEWSRREAAVSAFGAILDGPDPITLAPLVTHALSPLIDRLLNDSSISVRESVAWTLSKVTEHLLDVIDIPMHLTNLVSALVQSLNASSHITNWSCAALTKLVLQLCEANRSPDDEDMPKTSPMSPFYEGIYTALVPLSHSVSSDNNNRLVVYDTISNFIQCSAKDTSLLGEQVAGVMAARQRELIGVQSQLVGHDDFHNWNEMQVGIAVVLKAFINKSPAAAVAHCNDIMTNLLEIMNSSAKSGGILEEMFDTVGAIASALEGGFAMYLSAFVPYLRNALSLFNEYNVLLAALGCIDDLRAVGEALTPEAPGIMEALAKVLCEPSVSARVKPLAVTAIGNVAFAIGGHFTPYLGDTMTTLGQAGSIVPSADMDPDFVWQMRESIVQAVTEILGGLSGSNEAAFGQYVGPFLGFLQTCFADEQCTEEFVTGALGLIGDMAKTFKGSDLRGLFTQDWVKGAIAKGRVRGATKLSRGNAAYAQKWIDEM